MTVCRSVPSESYLVERRFEPRVCRWRGRCVLLDRSVPDAPKQTLIHLRTNWFDEVKRLAGGR